MSNGVAFGMVGRVLRELCVVSPLTMSQRVSLLAGFKDRPVRSYHDEAIYMAGLELRESGIDGMTEAVLAYV